VVITDRGKPAHVLLSFEHYQRLTGKGGNLLDALSMPGLAEIDFEPPAADIRSRPADFS
jgi:hypothetical protein